MRPPKRYHKITRCSGMPVACPSCLEGCRASGLICRDFDFRLLSGPGARPGMGPMEGEEEPLEEETQSKKGKKKEGKKPWPKKAWRPWRDRISDQQDAVLFVQSFVDVAEQLSRLLTVSANGVAIGGLAIGEGNPWTGRTCARFGASCEYFRLELELLNQGEDSEGVFGSMSSNWPRLHAARDHRCPCTYP
ncbi:unnamed protein product [Effrenium voratum]|nr:unnamed protein product [Effrenium voratum]